MDRLASMQTFVRVADAGSFSAAARQLGIGQPAVSKLVARLEARLGVRLLARSTRGLALTEDGRRYLEAARHALEAAEAAENVVSSRTAAPQGTVRLAASVAFGRLHIVPRLSDFFAQYPLLAVDLLLADRFVDLIEEGVDVAVRIGELTGEGLVARRIGATRRVTVASPDYLAQRGRPTGPAALAEHDCVLYTGLATGDSWPFVGPYGPISVKVSGRLRVSSSEGLRAALLAGLGIGVTPSWMWRDELASGALTRILTDYEPTSLPIQAVFPERRLVSPKVRAIVDHLAGAFRAEPSLSGAPPPGDPPAA